MQIENRTGRNPQSERLRGVAGIGALRATNSDKVHAASKVTNERMEFDVEAYDSERCDRACLIGHTRAAKKMRCACVQQSQVAAAMDRRGGEGVRVGERSDG